MNAELREDARQGAHPDAGPIEGPSSASSTRTPSPPLPLLAAAFRRQAIEASASERGVPEGSALAALRAEATRLLAIYRWPQPRFEGWRHFPLRALAKLDAAAPVDHDLSPARVPAGARLLEPHGASPTVLVRGDAHCLASGAVLPEGLHARPLVLKLAELPMGALTFVPRREETFAALNAALFGEGIHGTVESGVTLEAPLLFVHDAERSGAFLPRLRLELEAGAQATLVELFQGGGRSSLCAPVTEVVLGRGAKLTHLRLQVEDEAASHLGSFEAHLDAEAELISRVFSLGAARSRLTVRATMTQPEARVTLEGIALGHRKQHLEHHTFITHAAPGCESDETYRSILDDSACAVFDGVIEIARGCGQSLGAMENRNLLLSPEAVVHTKPRLLIDADDVKCSHGATVGQLDPAQLFYLRSRGFSSEAARGLLTLAFVRALADRIPEANLRALVLEALAARLPGVDETVLLAGEGAA